MLPHPKKDGLCLQSLAVTASIAWASALKAGPSPGQCSYLACTPSAENMIFSPSGPEELKNKPGSIWKIKGKSPKVKCNIKPVLTGRDVWASSPVAHAERGSSARDTHKVSSARSGLNEQSNCLHPSLSSSWHSTFLLLGKKKKSPVEKP